MNPPKDPKGYYAILGVRPNASAAEIKAAFRHRAMELHPDRNKSTTATRDFQHLNEAFSVLSDPAARAHYDTIAIARTEAAVRTAGEPPPSPIVCSACGKVTAQPRYAIFWEIKSFVFLTVRTPIQGIFCSACAEKKALKASLVTWIAGWWGFPWGPIYSIHALFNNLLGGERPADANARLAAYQAWVFAVAGKVEIARAVALDALDLAKKIKPEKGNAKVRKSLGYEVRDEGTELRNEIENLLEHLGGQSRIRLKDSWTLFRRPFFIQIAILAAAVTAIWIMVSSNSPPTPADENAAAKEGSGDVTPSMIETPRAASNPQYVRPLSADNGAPWPTASGYIKGYARRFTEGHSTLTIDNSRNSSDVFVKLYTRETSPPAPVRVFFVRRGDQYTIRNLRPGRYDVRHRDLDSGALSRSESFDIEETRTEGGIRFTQITMTLFTVAGGNMRSYPIDEADFH